jgi:hypothetical protein
MYVAMILSTYNNYGEMILFIAISVLARTNMEVVFTLFSDLD